MNDTFVIDLLKCCFNVEIVNQMRLIDDVIYIKLADGTRTKITAEKIA